ncbi:AAA family ATPase [Sulfurirhabdus autotrophica]|uniref:Exonuclease SbcC n=1 Tax=Sulfurirhabdus autotrophica TaxID=1706046 RepID=A0A4R3YER5_9PROT|nr:AAA family ATPase [Sulfurirhabdus autotrophica]TCV90667.1 exonuclease SbcC [Sulfurirhabdus autotrophica]
MKIVAIRGKNLASLEGGFAVEFEQAPLAGAGLFAITGPTGAGKSTILDALCLALFDEMPRLPGGQGVPVGRADEDVAFRTRSNDVRSILRRGAAEGFAEVEFIGSDNQRYLARWEVRRARNMASGRLQAQTMTLTSLANNQLIGRTKSDVQEAIRDRLGLSFEQFRRSVLLAQGDFASFLKADAKQRSELLERMTGTEIYGALSKAAHARAAIEEAEMKRLEQRLGDLLPMLPEERTALEVQYKDALTTQLQLDQSRQIIKRVIDWYARLDQLKAAEGEAITKVELADQVAVNAIVRRTEFESVQAVQPARALVERMDQSVQELSNAKINLEAALAEEKQSVNSVQELQIAVEADKATLLKHESERELNEPLLRKARELDSQLNSVISEKDDCQQAALEAIEKANEATKKQTEIFEQCQYVEKALTESEKWLLDNACYSELSSQWQRWDQEFTSLVEVDQSRQATILDLASSEESLPKIQQQLATEVDRQAKLKVSVTDIEKEIEALEAQVSASPLAQLQQDRERLNNRRNNLRVLLELHKRAVESNKQLTLIISEKERNKHESERLRTAIQKAKEQLIASQSALEEAERSQRLVITARKADVTSLRSELIEGESCPVCGSHEHPWVSSHPELDLMQDQMMGRIQALREVVSNLTGENGRMEAEYLTANKLVGEFETKKSTLLDDLANLDIQWNEACSEENISADVLAAETGGQLADSAEKVDIALKEIAESESQGYQFQKMLQEKRQALHQFSLALSSATESIAKLTLQLQKLNHDQEQQTSELAKAEFLRKQIIERLSPVLTGIDRWQQQLETDVQSLRKTCAQIIGQWHEQINRRDEAAKGLAINKEKLAAARIEVTHRDESSIKAQTALNDVLAKLTGIEAQRKKLLSGRAADQVENELKAAVTSANIAFQAAQSKLSKASEQLASSRKSVQHWQEGKAKMKDKNAYAESSVNAVLAKHEISLERLKERLAHDEEWLRVEQVELNKIHTQLLETKARLAALQEQRVAHEEADVPTTNLENANAQLVETEALYQSLQDSIAEIRASLKQDDEKQNQGVALRGELQKQQDKWQIWGGLKELIGSQDGSKFRTFAQSLTLDALLGYANRHLEELARRYLLQRVPGSDLELQVIDREMGDEVRSVHSLSGGESFLISLALALGLASLSSNRTQVESLFIDEGFGSLDPATLDIAIASLDALQSLGRKVGVISHVPAMVERIGVQVRVGVHGGGKSSVKTFGAFVD